MKVAIPKETAEAERRVALVPDTATKLIAAGLQVSVQAGAGASAYLNDSAYQAAGVTVEPDESALFKDAGAVLKVQPPTEKDVHFVAGFRLYQEALALQSKQTSDAFQAAVRKYRESAAQFAAAEALDPEVAGRLADVRSLTDWLGVAPVDARKAASLDIHAAEVAS